MIEVTMRERKKEATKLNILAAAIDLMQINGFTDTTMQQIAEKSDVALRTLYNYYPSKESIVATYIQKAVQEEVQKGWGELLELDSTYQRLRFMCQKSAEWMSQNFVLIEVYAADPRNYYYGSTGAEIPRSGYDEVVKKVIELGQQNSDINHMIPAALLTRQYMGIYYFSILTWLSDPKQDLFEIFLDGLEILYQGMRPDGLDTGTVMYGMLW